MPDRLVPAAGGAPWHRVEATLLSLSRSIRELYDVRLRELDISLTDASLIAYVDEHGPLSQIRLAAAMGMVRSSAGVRIARLEARGLVQRDVDPDDARVWMVSVTRAGADFVGRVGEIDRQVRAELRVGTSRDERVALVRAMEHIHGNVRSALQRG